MARPIDPFKAVETLPIWALTRGGRGGLPTESIEVACGCVVTKYVGLAVAAGENYRQFAKRLQRSIHQVHRDGEKLIIDYAGPTVALRVANTPTALP